jgi:hypothetical protein
MDYLKRFINNGVPAAPNGLTLDNFKYLISNFEHFSNHCTSSDAYPELSDDFMHRYTNFTIDEIIFKLFCNIESSHNLIEAVKALTDDEDLIDSASFKTTEVCHAHWIKFMELYFESSDKVDTLLSKIKESRSVYDSTRTFYGHYNIKKAVTFTRRENVKRTYAVLLDLQKKTNLEMHKRYLNEFPIDILTLDTDCINIAVLDYNETVKVINDYDSTEDGLPLKNSLMNFSSKMLQGISKFFQKVINELCAQKMFESPLFSCIGSFFKEKQNLNLKNEILSDFSVEKMISKFISELIEAWHSSLELSGFEGFTVQISHICDQLEELISATGKSGFLKDFPIKIDFHQSFSHLLGCLKDIPVEKVVDLGYLQRLCSLYKLINTTEFYQENFQSEFHSYIQNLFENLTVSHFYNCVLLFDMKSFSEFSISYNLEGFLPELFNDKNFEDFLKRKQSEQKSNFKMLYNQFSKEIFSRLVKSLQDFIELKQYWPGVERKIKLEVLIFNLLGSIDLDGSKHDRKIEDGILNEPSYLQHKLKVLQRYQLSSFEDFAAWKSELAVETKKSFDCSPESVNLHKELYEITDKISTGYHNNEKAGTNSFMFLRNRLNFSLMMFCINELLGTLKEFFVQSFGEELENFGYCKSTFDNFVELYFNIKPNHQHLTDYVATLKANLNPNEDSVIYFSIIFEKLIKDFKTTWSFIQFTFSHFMCERYSWILQKALVKHLLADVVFVSFNSEAVIEDSHIREGLSTLQNLVKQELTFLSKEAVDFSDCYIALIKDYLSSENDLDMKLEKMRSIKAHVNVSFLLSDLITKKQLLAPEKKEDFDRLIAHITRDKLLVI